MYTLRNGLLMDIVPYIESHASSIAINLFDGLEVNIVIQQRAELLAPGPDEIWSVCAVIEEQVVGICTGVRKRWFGERHRIEMVQVVVHDKHQGVGIARLMMGNIAKHFLNRGVELVQISVEATNEQAITAYERIGFREFGVLTRGLKHNDEYSDEIMMVTDIQGLLNT
ncbi:MAG: GNAT family N-acetyltransferase [Candidatus Thorarchaeota archaeon]